MQQQIYVPTGNARAVIAGMIEGLTGATVDPVDDYSFWSGRSRYWVLDNARNARRATVFEWAQMLCSDRRVARTVLAGGVVVSTVFLGLDRNHSRRRPTLIFETRVFSGEGEFQETLERWRYSTWAQAEEGHAKLVAEFGQSAAFVSAIRQECESNAGVFNQPRRRA